MSVASDLRKWSKAILTRDGLMCQVCGAKHGAKNYKGNRVNLNAHHIIDKQSIETRLLLDNGIALCPKCHKFGNYSAHKNSVWFACWLAINKPDVFTKLNEYIK